METLVMAFPPLKNIADFLLKEGMSARARLQRMCLFTANFRKE